MREGLLRYPVLVRIALLVVVVSLGVACDNGDSPTDPTDRPTETQTFTGRIERNGSMIHTFTTGGPGRVTATITSVTPAGSPAFGFSMGTWDPTFEVCTAVNVNNAATTSSVLTGTVVATSSLCIRLFDSTAAIPTDTPVDYAVTVERP